MLAGFTSSFHSPVPFYLCVFLSDLIFFLLFKLFFVPDQNENNSMEPYNRLELSYRRFFKHEIHCIVFFYIIYVLYFRKVEKDLFRRDRNKKKFSCTFMNIYPEEWWWPLNSSGNFHMTRERWRCIWQNVLFGGFSTSPSLRGHPQPPFPGGGLFPINMHYVEADKRSERPAVPL